MKWASVVIVMVLACSGSGSSPHDDAATASGTTFMLSGTFSNPFSAVQTGTMIVGVANPADVSPKVDCSKLIVKTSVANQTLPATYQLPAIPQGDYVLVGLLLDGSSAQAPIAVYSITVDSSGVHAHTQIPIETLNIACQGMIAYASCP